MSVRTDSPFGHEERESSQHTSRPAVLAGVGLLLALLASLVAFAPTVSAGGDHSHDGTEGERHHGVTVECHPESGTWTAVFLVKNWKGAEDGHTSFDDVTVLDGRHMRVTALSASAGSLSGLDVGDVVLIGDSSTTVTVSGIPVATTSVSLEVAAEWRWYTIRTDAFVEGHVEIDGKFYAGLETKTDTRTKIAHIPEGCEAPPAAPEPEVIIVPPVAPVPPVTPAPPAGPDDAAVGDAGAEAGAEADVEAEAGVVAGSEIDAGVVGGAETTVETDDAAVAGIGVEAGGQAGGGTLPRTGLATAPFLMAATALLGLGAGFRAVASRLQ
jgi:hypothetical protein